MSDWDRRSVLETGAALSVGSGVASIAAGQDDSGESAVESLPDPSLEPNPDQDEDWASFAGDASHSRSVEADTEFDADALEAAWSVGSAGPVAVADDTVYTSTADGVAAFDAADGTLVWENATVDASEPAVVGETVYVTGDEVVALDTSDGSVRWESEFDTDAPLGSPTVAYGAVYVGVDGTLYALETDDGSVRWRKESISAPPDPEADEEAEYEFIRDTAAANGVVYALSWGGAVAFEPETGAEVWLAPMPYLGTAAKNTQVRATASTVAVGNSQAEHVLVNAQTGGEDILVASESAGWALDDEIYVTGTDHQLEVGAYEHEYYWQIENKSNAGHAVIYGDTVYVYFSDTGPEGEGAQPYSTDLVAVNKYDGTEQWVLSNDDVPVGHVRAISDGTIYVDRSGELVALREGAGDEGGGTEDGDQGDGDSADGGDGNEGTDEGDDATEGSDGTADETESDCSNESADADSDCGGDGNASDAGDDSDGSDGDGGNGTGGENASDSGGLDGGSNGNGNANDSAENGTPNETDGSAEGDTVPGFTTGAGIVSGALGLEWVRRQAGSNADDSTE
ncbi:outer membrane protein assembly factor BamB family protein [Natrialba asiatica]|uniref:Pyrrolo-quinoline quinone n=1 Tax=Natrialba asiatica (strain ATCC 700177 / DSM 12278 / JCM 9576 / FERM P-10747 / NBRC 102637 / 172P1) TaxID=29540 RepID=M0ASG2_NATA1|nr:PQQ-binding-like beta-propeller repeat protein [Natrialba asiatica]ELZ00888.1 pyrrolo-quinoline quinone [Natrialba asiatica DSM 12278]